MPTHCIVSIETAKAHQPHHEVISAVHTQDLDTGAAKRWTTAAVLKAMDQADRFYTVASNGRTARIQRHTCGVCKSEHIRTHISDRAIHELRILPRAVAMAPTAR